MATTPTTGVGMFGPTVTDLRQQYLKNLQGQFSSAQSPYERMGLALGNILGTAFGVKDPALEQASTVQSIYSAVAMNHPDQTTPEFYRELANTFAAAGLNEQALMSSEKAREVGRLAAADVRAERGLAIQEEQLLLQQVDKDPYGSIERAMTYPENDPRRSIIITGASAKIGEKNTAEAIRMAEIAKTTAQTELARAQLGQVGAGSVSESVATEDGKPLEKRGGKFYTMDGKVYTGAIKRLSASEDLLSRLGRLEDGSEGGAAGGKKTLTDAEVRARLRGEKPPTSPTPPVPSRSATDRVPPRPPDSFNGVRNPEAATWDRLYGATHNRNGSPK
jgi:hypothetical protein